MTPCNVCNSVPDENPGKAIADLPALAGRVEKVKTDFKLWISIFRCKECGQIWEERYESKGHANVPTVRKKMSQP